MTTITTEDGKTIDAASLRASLDDCKAKGESLGNTLFGLVPLSGRTIEVQDAFLMAYSDFRRLGESLEEAEKMYNGVSLGALPTEGDDTDEKMISRAKRLIDHFVQKFGVSPEVIMPAITRDLYREVCMIQSIIARIETNLAKVIG